AATSSSDEPMVSPDAAGCGTRATCSAPCSAGDAAAAASSPPSAAGEKTVQPFALDSPVDGTTPPSASLLASVMGLSMNTVQPRFLFGASASSGRGSAVTAGSGSAAASEVAGSAASEATGSSVAAAGA